MGKKGSSASRRDGAGVGFGEVRCTSASLNRRGRRGKGFGEEKRKVQQEGGERTGRRQASRPAREQSHKVLDGRERGSWRTATEAAAQLQAFPRPLLSLRKDTRRHFGGERLARNYQRTDMTVGKTTTAESSQRRVGDAAARRHMAKPELRFLCFFRGLKA